MGLLVSGKWVDRWYDTSASGGRFLRQASQFRNWITPDGAPGPGGEGGFAAEAGRYRLYVSLACPWAHRTLILRRLKGLEAAIPLAIVHWLMGPNGWEFRAEDGATADPEIGARFLYELYAAAQPAYTGRVTVPVLWDRRRKTIVSNESSEILRMFNSAFAGIAVPSPDFYPEDLRPRIDDLNARIYETVNNGVYRCGFATTQIAYDEAFAALFASLDWLEEILGRSRYLAGGAITEADWRLFTTLVRFDAVYAVHFKCDRRRIADYPNLSNYMRELYQVPGIAGTVNMAHIRGHYFASHPSINPHGIISGGPILDFLAPHDRTRLAADL